MLLVRRESKWERQVVGFIPGPVGQAATFCVPGQEKGHVVVHSRAVVCDGWQKPLLGFSRRGFEVLACH